MLKVMRYAILLQFKKKSMGEKWELITNTAEFADPADVIFLKKRERGNK